jgi:ribosomal protein L12E/L44/L45/RPP1/RPP2
MSAYENSLKKLERENIRFEKKVLKIKTLNEKIDRPRIQEAEEENIRGIIRALEELDKEIDEIMKKINTVLRRRSGIAAARQKADL